MHLNIHHLFYTNADSDNPAIIKCFGWLHMESLEYQAHHPLDSFCILHKPVHTCNSQILDLISLLSTTWEQPVLWIQAVHFVLSCQTDLASRALLFVVNGCKSVVLNQYAIDFCHVFCKSLNRELYKTTDTNYIKLKKQIKEIKSHYYLWVYFSN